MNVTEASALAPESPPLRLDEQKVIRVGKTRVTPDTVVALV